MLATERGCIYLGYRITRVQSEAQRQKALACLSETGHAHMVSHSVVEPLDHTLAVKRPSSVSSRASTSRRHRQHRSHHGGSSYQPQNEFPIFSQTGDVDIVIRAGGKEQRYLLHRLILAQCSGFFEASTSQQWSRATALDQDGGAQELAVIREGERREQDVGRPRSADKTGNPTMRWHYELDRTDRADENGGDAEDRIPMLVQRATAPSLFGGDSASRAPAVRNKPPASHASFFRSMANLSALQVSNPNTPQELENDTSRDYDNLFRTFYNYPPTLDATNIANAYVQCKSLLNLADMYDALEVVGPRVDHHLLQFQGRLWKQIAKYPPSYLKIGYLARSKVIFSEALVHVVGQWPSGINQIRSQLPEQVLEVIEDKVDELEEMKTKIEGRLFRLTLTTPRGERVTPSNSYLSWTAVSLFRQWLAENTTPPPPIATPKEPSRQTDPRNPAARMPPPLPPATVPPTVNTGRIYRLLGAGGSSYLPREELKRFLKIRPEDYNRDTVRKFEQRMDEMKLMAREITKPLMRNYLELDLGRDAGGLGYLTCTRVEERDFPWQY
ncbi:MAG: hypothetical protein M1825_005857 [Sarcosagium campestre]|nr:MAG: hypothetical protein M1825_005857 [Sarcosagium campestre]